MSPYLILLNASNLHVGGGVQVATSVIAELTRLSTLPEELSVWCSTAVHQNLIRQQCDLTRLPDYHVIDSHGLWISNEFRKRLSGFDAVFTIFGPLYTRYSGYQVVGFAQPWLIYPDNEIYREMGYWARLRSRIKYGVQSHFFRRANRVVVELEHVRDRLSQRKICRRENIVVIPNCLSHIYSSPESWENISFPQTSGLKLGFIGRNYPHKNTRIFPEIADELFKSFGVSVRFFVTFTDAEWDKCSEDFRAVAVNVGPLSVSQCPDFYSQVDAVVFPSLLECFSATPLEAMAMGKPLFSSDRPFNRDVCGDHAYYFDPLDAKAAAHQIWRVFGSGPLDEIRIKLAQAHAFGFSNARARALAYLDVLKHGFVSID